MKPGALHSLYHLYRLQQRLTWSVEKLDALRRKKLAALLRYCYQNIPYYQEQFRLLGAQPQDFQQPTDLVHFPILEKVTLRDNPEAFMAPRADRRKWLSYRSSGSTGIPLDLWYLPEERQKMGFLMTREFLFHGLKPWHRLVNLTEPRHFSPKERWYHRLGLMNEQFLSIFDATQHNLERLRDIKPHYLIGFPSILMLIGRRMREDGGAKLRPLRLFTLAEVLTPEDRSFLNKAWGDEPVDLYGCNETGHIAFQCEKRQGYHINVDSVHVEIIAGGQPVGVGQRGEVVVTNFDLRVMPIIRYRVGDVAQLSSANCSCSCRFPLLGNPAGRSDGFLIAADGKIYSALEIALFLKDVPGIQQYRLIQLERGRIEVEWVPGDRAAQPEDALRRLLQERMGRDTQITIRQVAEIVREQSGKIRTVISKLPHPFQNDSTKKL